jgi:hypothetical protein
MYTTILLAAALQDWERYSVHALAARDVAATLAKGAAQEIALREKRSTALQRRRAQKTVEQTPSAPRAAKRKRASTQTTLV